MTTMPETGNDSLAGLRVLVVEDDYFIAHEICSTLGQHGAEVLGPSPDVEDCMNLIHTQRIDCAVLDINLHGTLTYGLARELLRWGTPTIFATGYDRSMLPAEFSGCIQLQKPINLSALLRAVQSVCKRPEPAQPGWAN
jgi:DNA-binding response OmpR family regulator